jgi:hypothetical protein
MVLFHRDKLANFWQFFKTRNLYNLRGQIPTEMPKLVDMYDVWSISSPNNKSWKAKCKEKQK